jgi:hypothetical protein
MNTTCDTDASVGSKSIRAAGASVAKRLSMWPILMIALGLLASLAWSIFLAWEVGRMIGVFGDGSFRPFVGVRVMQDASVDFFNQYWPYDFLSRFWPYAALAAAVVVLVLLWKTSKRVRRLEAQVKSLQGELFQIQQRRFFETIRSNSVPVIEINQSDGLSIAPTGPTDQETSGTAILPSASAREKST